MVVCFFCWIIHLVSSILLCVWGCEGNNLEDIKAKEKKEAQRKADEEAAMRKM